MKTYKEWKTLFAKKDLKYLQNQTRGYIMKHNLKVSGAAYGDALIDSIKERHNQGEIVLRKKATSILPVEEEQGEVEIIRCGGKGQTMRIVHPKV